MRQPGKCAGTQGRTMPLLAQLIPPHRHHVVVFGGMLGELLGKQRSSPLETINDINRMTTNYYLTIKYDVEALIERLISCPYSHFFFKEAKKLLADGRGSSLDLAEAYGLVANQSMGNGDPTVKGVRWSLSYKGANQTRRWERIDDTLRLVSRRLRRVQILDGWPWERVLDKFDSKDTFFSCDPPFHPSTLLSQTALYKYRMTNADHERLLIRLHQLQGSWMLFGYECDLYRHYLAGNEPVRVMQSVSISTATIKPIREKCVWFKY